ncbi:flagellar hook-basal body protein [Candidatus Poribacteria bacterium]|nr:flagellar hook-basal body protein [Candidatus Poribacteria bacterium]
MLRGVYAAASGMIGQRERLDVIADNLTNVSTAAFKRAEPISRGFYQVFAGEIRRFPSERGSGEIPGGGSALDATAGDFSIGSIIDTGNPLDAAIEGSGFFVVETPAGERYTRAGNFSLDAEGRLVSQDGYFVRGQQGPIVARGASVRLSQAGDVLVDGASVDRLLVVDFPRPYQLSKYGQNLYGAVEEVRQTQSPVQTSSLRVSALERSNVNPISELVSLMDTARMYEADQRIIQAIDESLNAAVNQIART